MSGHFNVFEVVPWIKSVQPRMTLKACTLLLLLLLLEWPFHIKFSKRAFGEFDLINFISNGHECNFFFFFFFFFFSSFFFFFFFFFCCCCCFVHNYDFYKLIRLYRPQIGHFFSENLHFCNSRRL